jgi:hypothetical protein
VRHIRKELALVAGYERDLLGAVFESALGLLDLEVLLLDLLLLLGEQTRFLLQLEDRLTQLLLLRALQLF